MGQIEYYPVKGYDTVWTDAQGANTELSRQEVDNLGDVMSEFPLHSTIYYNWQPIPNSDKCLEGEGKIIGYLAFEPKSLFFTEGINLLILGQYGLLSISLADVSIESE